MKPASILTMRLFAMASLLLLSLGARAWAEGEVVNLELVLAVDASASVNAGEYDLQMQGLELAFRDPRVQQAVAGLGPNGIAVTLVVWADARHQMAAVEWRRLTDAASMEAFADAIGGTGRLLEGGGTAIGGVISYALRSINSNGYQSARQVVDVSGDGRANQGENPGEARDRAVALGLVINGLAILNEDSSLFHYYQRYVIGGNGAFLVTAQNYQAFADAIRDKLIREIGASPIVSLPPPQWAGVAPP